MKKEKIDLTNLLKEINLAEEQCLETLKKLRQQRLELTKHDMIPFTVSEIHRDRRYTVINLIQKVDDEKNFDELENEWNATATADPELEGWFGIIEACGEKEKLISILPKLAKNGCDVKVDPAVKIKIPAPDRWYEPGDFSELLKNVKLKKGFKTTEKKE